MGAQRLFGGNIGLIYPDFISRISDNRVIADAKYKPLDNIGNKDYLQLLAYMFRFDAKLGFYLYPESTGEEDLVLHLNSGTTFEKHYGGNHRNMSEAEEAAFLEAYIQQTEQGHLLDVREIAAAYEEKVGHQIGNSQIYRVLHRHKWRKVMPRSKHPNKASEEVIETSKKLIPESRS